MRPTFVIYKYSRSHLRPTCGICLVSASHLRPTYVPPLIFTYVYVSHLRSTFGIRLGFCVPPQSHLHPTLTICKCFCVPPTSHLRPTLAVCKYLHSTLSCFSDKLSCGVPRRAKVFACISSPYPPLPKRFRPCPYPSLV